MNPWLPYRRPRDRAKLRLFAFHYAGGSATAFLQWRALLPDSIELCSVQLPGRERRLGEAAFTTMAPLVDAALSGLGDALAEGPYALFGHSLGAKLAYELAQRLEASDSHDGPVHLFVSAARGPTLPRPSFDAPKSEMPHDQLLDALREYGGAPEEVLGNEDLMALLLPTIRADFSVSETWRPADPKSTEAPLSALGGMSDPYCTPDELQAWSLHTPAFSRHLFPGGHFYLEDEMSRLVHLVVGKLGAHLT